MDLQRLLHSDRNLGGIVCRIAIFFVQSPPLESAHLALDICKNTADTQSITLLKYFEFIYIRIFAMKAHVGIDIPLAYPIKRTFRKSWRLFAVYIHAPFLDIGVLAIAEFFFGKRHKRSGIRGIAHFLTIQRYPSNVDRLKPVYDFTFRAFAYINKQFRIQNLGFFVLHTSTLKYLHLVSI